VRKLLVCLGILGLAPMLTGAAHAFGTMPDNPIAFGNCTAKVKVDAARLRSGPSLDSKVLGVRVQDDPLFVTKVYGKWVQVEMTPGDTAYIAAYLLSFPANEILEQWKRENPSPSVGKKAKVKWAKVHFRKYPSAQSPRLGHFSLNDEIAVLTDLGNGWSMVEGRKPDGDGKGNCFGFVANRALSAPDVPEPPGWSAPLAQVRLNPGEKMEQVPVIETPSHYCQRTAWTPELFVMELRQKSKSSLERHDNSLNPAPEQLLAIQ
jgi:SH3 domain-containing protein